jgi:ElaB/YqjD/DUF883 family membrane-anchored ribosome-binding protein
MNDSQSEPAHDEPFNAERLKKLGADAAEDVAQFIKKYPLQTVGGVLVLGVVLGLMINKKRSSS